MIKKLTVMVLSGMICLLGVSSVLAQTSWVSPQEYEKATGERIERFNEAPMLKTQVAAGELPRVEERLPKNPKVVKPLNEIGAYGGTLNRGTASPTIGNYLLENMTTEPLFQFPWPFPGSGPVESNLADKWEFSEDGTGLTVHLREGIKWSDGYPFTADDVLFYWEDVLFNEKSLVTPNPNLYIEKGVAPELEKIDDYTVKFTFPYPFFFAETAFTVLREWAWPKHYMKQFHPDYNENATWEEWNKHIDWIHRGKVTLQAWMLDWYEPGGDLVVVRNPYYWKVDTEGNQLPYIDRVRVHAVESRETIALKNVAGELDWDCMWVGTQHLSMFMEEKERKDYDVGFARVSGMAFYFNYDTPDETARKIMRNVNFRRAFSLAINREMANRVMFSDMLYPSSWTFSTTSAYYDEEVAKLYTEFDPERAKQLLDEAGFKDRDGDGWRELPTGEEVKLIVDVSQHDLYVPLLEMVVEDLAKVGVKLVMNVQLQQLIGIRRAAGEFQMHVWDFYGVDEPLAMLELWVPVSESLPFWHPKAFETVLHPEDSFDEAYAQFAEILMKARGLPYQERVVLMKKANNLMAENVFGVHLGYYMRPFIVSNRIGNAAKSVARSDAFGGDTPPFRVHQFYVKYER